MADSLTFDGQTYAVWKAGGSITFVSGSNLTVGEGNCFRSSSGSSARAG